MRRGAKRGAQKRRPMMGSVSGFDSSSVNILLSSSLARLAADEETRAKSFRIRRWVDTVMDEGTFSISCLIIPDRRTVGENYTCLIISNLKMHNVQGSENVFFQSEQSLTTPTDFFSSRNKTKKYYWTLPLKRERGELTLSPSLSQEEWMGEKG